ncbi:GCN5 family acetyltransferase [Acinetobacter sp. NCu2D-2]|uniref:GNAT family N-acetyltransferase n=1 Tax=Acinetobacter sp. NCu2D-2 TaxID=1608473 RepID=UPI0007CDD0C2|nr:GNAT family N-acetyltransferase [Acinetobacter sp. NCu2D-2]ANF80733.1 GCN5 family acetyltransferase [Acinetobacter sp. NCu2D-2]
MNQFNIRAAKYSDLSAIEQIYNHHVTTGCATWNTTPFNPEHFQRLFDHLKDHDFPFFVVEETSSQDIVGYADYSHFRHIQGFSRTVELSIFLKEHYSGYGLGSRLLTLLIEHAKRHHKHVIVAAIDSENQASIHLHRKFSFQQTGFMPQVGQKFGQWRDLVLMQLILDE